MSDFDALARSAADGNKEDFFTLLTQLVKPQLDLLNAATGNNWLAPTNSPQKPSSPPPPVAGLSAVGANGSFTLAVSNPRLSVSAQIWHEISYSAVKGFSSGVTTLEPSTSTNVTVAAPGQTMFFRVRSSYDRANWNTYTLASTVAESAGLQSSAATSNAVALNISNYATVDSVAAGSGADIRVYGVAGPRTMWPGVKGTEQTVYPSATIIGASLGAEAIVGFQNGQFMVAKDLPQVFADDIVPVGKVGTPGANTVVLPTIVAVIGGGGVTGFNVTVGGSNLTASLALAIGGPGVGATAGVQTIVGGVLLSVGPGAPGTGYVTVPTVTPSGGVSPGTPGGGTVVGGNGGRLTAIT